MPAAAMAPVSALRTVRCTACSSSALRLFVSNVAGARLQVATPSSRRLVPAAAARFSTFRPSPRLLQGPAIEERIEAQRAKDQNDASPAPDSPDSDVPWYLQVEAPRHPTLVREQAPLPAIPDESPKLMEPLLKFVSDELGMDDVKLLDLREMDPPPALGPNLIMIFGTARSERHLHVSADRLARWLRGRGIAAQADGLLGRNELKVKLRRAARKAKLLGNAGVARGGDDGISTGWICVNLGSVEGSHEERVMLDAKGRPTGFGVPQTGTTVVVQMLTGPRREELDMESLWMGMLKGSLKKRGLPVSEELEAAGSPFTTTRE